MPTHHMNANKGDFAKVVLMPGDPVRAKWIAENFLHDYKLINEVRGLLAFTGYTKDNKRISVMASGMGMPSIAIISYELFTYFDVDAIIRVGTCGSYQENIKMKDVLICSRAITDSNFSTPDDLPGVRNSLATKDLVETAINEAIKSKLNYHVGDIYSADVFYDVDPNFWKKWQKLGAMGVEMESYALYLNAIRTNKKALCISTVTDCFASDDKSLSAEERASGLKEMIELSIKTAEHYC